MFPNLNPLQLILSGRKDAVWLQAKKHIYQKSILRGIESNQLQREEEEEELFSSVSARTPPPHLWELSGMTFDTARWLTCVLLFPGEPGLVRGQYF